MTALAQIIFWTCLGILFYCYIGYGILVAPFAFFSRKRHAVSPAEFPSVSLVIVGYNEEEILQQKIQNTMVLRYPGQKLSLIFVSDGSTDNTASIMQQYENVHLINKPDRKGKTA